MYPSSLTLLYLDFVLGIISKKYFLMTLVHDLGLATGAEDLFARST